VYTLNRKIKIYMPHVVRRWSGLAACKSWCRS